jgi:hypothetical protein
MNHSTLPQKVLRSFVLAALLILDGCGTSGVGTNGSTLKDLMSRHKALLIIMPPNLVRPDEKLSPDKWVQVFAGQQPWANDALAFVFVPVLEYDRAKEHPLEWTRQYRIECCEGSASASPSDAFAKHREAENKGSGRVTFQVIQETPSDVTYEEKIGHRPDSPETHRLGRLMLAAERNPDTGYYPVVIVSYVVKTEAMTVSQREEGMQLISAPQFVSSPGPRVLFFSLR